MLVDDAPVLSLVALMTLIKKKARGLDIVVLKHDAYKTRRARKRCLREREREGERERERMSISMPTEFHRQNCHQQHQRNALKQRPDMIQSPKNQQELKPCQKRQIYIQTCRNTQLPFKRTIQHSQSPPENNDSMTTPRKNWASQGKTSRLQ